MVFPYSPHLLQRDICSIKSSFLRQVSDELKISQDSSPPYESFTLYLFSDATILYQIRSAACSGAAFGCQALSMRYFSSKTYTHLHQHKPQSSNFCLKGFKNQGSQNSTEEKRHSSEFKYSAPIVNIMQNAGIAKLYF